MDLQPKYLKDYIGQDNIKKSILIAIKASKKRKEPFPHVLLHGASGLGKTTLAHVIAKEFQSRCKTILAPVITSHDQIYDSLTKCKKNDFLFIDEVHALPRQFQETLYSAMTDRKITVVKIDGYTRKPFEKEVTLKPFTCITATTELGELAVPFRERFGFIIPLTDYSHEEIKTIISNNGKKIKLNLDDSALDLVTNASKKNPRSANRLLERCRDTATVEDTNHITEEIVLETLTNLQIEPNGLNLYDIKILETLFYKFHAKPTGLKTLSLITSIDQKAIENQYEPYLIELDFIERQSRGRVITQQGINYILENK